MTYKIYLYLASILIAIVLGVICQYKISNLDEENVEKGTEGEISILKYHNLS